MKEYVETKQQCEKIFKILARRGHMISSQRRILIEALCEQKRIENIETFWMALRKRHGISWAAVYANMRLLINMGLVTKEGDKYIANVVPN